MTEPTALVTSSDGVRLAVYEHGDRTAPTVVAVHGYPDNHGVWDGVAPLLAERFHVVTYDVRGAGGSDKPTDRASYRLPRLIDDLRAVLDAFSPAGPAHLLGHDWGSVQCWAAVSDERLAPRIASFTSISGPSLEQTTAWLRRGYRYPRAALRQLLDSYYVALFQLPAVPEALWRGGHVDRLMALVGRLGGGANAGGPVGPPQRSEADKINGLQLYRANLLHGAAARPPRRITVPVQVIAPRGDIFVTVALQTRAPLPYVDSLRVHEVDGGHWIVCDRPELIAAHTADLVDAVAAGTVQAATPNARSSAPSSSSK